VYQGPSESSYSACGIRRLGCTPKSRHLYSISDSVCNMVEAILTVVQLLVEVFNFYRNHLQKHVVQFGDRFEVLFAVSRERFVCTVSTCNILAQRSVPCPQESTYSLYLRLSVSGPPCVSSLLRSINHLR
jgi:hypothetical protein